MNIAGRRLSVHISAVTQLFGPEVAKLSAEGWLDESELMDSPPLASHKPKWAGGHDRGLGKTGKSAGRHAASQMRSRRWCKDSSALHARVRGAVGGMKAL